jgi:hypothetical protein
MNIYSGQTTNSDVDAFKNSGVIQSASVTFSGVLTSGQMITLQTTPITATSPDFAQFLFENSAKHSGKFKNIAMEGITMVFESTNGSELACDLNVIISGDQIKFSATLFNPYAISVNLQTTTLTFRYIPYEATF